MDWILELQRLRLVTYLVINAFKSNQRTFYHVPRWYVWPVHVFVLVFDRDKVDNWKKLRHHWVRSRPFAWAGDTLGYCSGGIRQSLVMLDILHWTLCCFLSQRAMKQAASAVCWATGSPVKWVECNCRLGFMLHPQWRIHHSPSVSNGSMSAWYVFLDHA